jgi:Zn-dependent metalloprotease
MGNMSRIPKMILAAAIVWMLLMGQAIAASSGSTLDTGVFPQKEQNALVDQLNQLTGSKVRMGTHALTGKVRYIGVDPANPIRQPAGLSAKPTPEEAARGFLSTYGTLFGLVDQARELSVMHTKSGEQGRSFVRFQQVYSSIPVLGGELIVQSNSSNDIVSANGKVLPDVSVDTTPVISADVAIEKALALVLKYYGRNHHLDKTSLQVSKPELWIYNPMILGVNQNLTHLVWRMEVFPTELLPIKELVLVDAHLGKVVLHFNQIDTALYRKIYDQANANPPQPLPGTNLARSEGQGASGISDVNYAYDYAGDTYNFYLNYHGRNSLDNAGMQLISTTRYCDPSYPCPYQNAFWNGDQMVYGQSFSSGLDVVGHEMTHGVTSYESNLFYFMQSGAINESFSDIWGEFIEQVNGLGEANWLMGQHLPIGAIRSMSNPPAYGDPDRMGSANYVCGGSDSGGVHTNSGVSNKAAYLIANGGPFNGLIVAGIGITKAAKIYYEVQTHLFTSAGDYNDLYDALPQACANLVGTSGITVADCQQVEKAVNATEMNQQPASCQAQEAVVCNSGQINTVFFDDMENPSSGKWTHGAFVGSNVWTYTDGYAASGTLSLYGYDPNSAGPNDSYIVTTQPVAIPAGAFLHFKHAYVFEISPYGDYCDGGIIEYTFNSGLNWNQVPAAWLTSNGDPNGYNGTIATVYNDGFNTPSDNPLKGKQAFVGYSPGYISTRINLSTLAGNNVQFRFRVGADTGNYDGYDLLGWLIDDVRIYSCAAAACGQFGFNEDFNDGAANNWIHGGSGGWSVTGGTHRMTGTGSGNWAGAAYNGSYCDFTYQIRLRQTAGTPGNSMGIWFRANSANIGTGNGYGFWIGANGYYALFKYIGGSTSTLISWNTSSAINTGLGAWNVLKVVALGSKISIYANGTLLNTVTDSSYLSGYVGAGAFDQSVAPFSVVEFDVATLDTKKKLGMLDFENDWKTDLAVYDVANGWWYFQYSSSGGYGFDAIGVGGGSRWVPVAGDYDGDGKMDVAVYDTVAGWWLFHYSSGGYFYDHIGQGGTGFTAVPGDYDGDGATDLAVYQQSTGYWYIKYSWGGYGFNSLGGPGKIPVQADYDGDGITDVAVYDVASGEWYFQYSSTGAYGFDAIGVGGGSRWVPVPGDYDGDGKADVAVYDTVAGWWLFHYSSGGYSYDHIGQGGTGFTAVPGYYDGDGKSDLAVYQQSTGYWYIKYSSGGYGFKSLGGSGRTPVR